MRKILTGKMIDGRIVEQLQSELEKHSIQPSTIIMSEDTFKEMQYWTSLEAHILERVSANPEIVQALRQERQMHPISYWGTDRREIIPGLTSYYVKIMDQEWSVSEEVFKQVWEIVQELPLENDFEWEDE